MPPARRRRPGSRLEEVAAELRAFSLAYPETHEDFPWGHSAYKVRGKIFVIAGVGEDGLRLSVKLPESHSEALLLPFTEPTHYGMGKHGWVTASFGPEDEPPLFLLRGWIDESYRAIAPKRVVAVLEGGAGEKAAKKKARKKASRKRAR